MMSCISLSSYRNVRNVPRGSTSFRPTAFQFPWAEPEKAKAPINAKVSPVRRDYGARDELIAAGYKPRQAEALTKLASDVIEMLASKKDFDNLRVAFVTFNVYLGAELAFKDNSLLSKLFFFLKSYGKA